MKKLMTFLKKCNKLLHNNLVINNNNNHNINRMNNLINLQYLPSHINKIMQYQVGVIHMIVKVKYQKMK